MFFSSGLSWDLFTGIKWDEKAKSWETYALQEEAWESRSWWVTFTWVYRSTPPTSNPSVSLIFSGSYGRKIHKPGLTLSWMMMTPTLWFVFNKNWGDTLGFAWSFYWKNIHRYTNLWLDFRVGSWYWYLQEHANLGSVDHWFLCLKIFALLLVWYAKTQRAHTLGWVCAHWCVFCAHQKCWGCLGVGVIGFSI